jgi:hypothetical protein
MGGKVQGKGKKEKGKRKKEKGKRPAVMRRFGLRI